MNAEQFHEVAGADTVKCLREVNEVNKQRCVHSKHCSMMFPAAQRFVC